MGGSHMAFFFPLVQGLTIPPLILRKIMPFSSWLHWRSWLGFILIKVHIYMMPKLICVVYHDIPSATISITEHNTTKSMVGLLAFSSTPWLITIYTSYAFNANGVKTVVLHSPPPSIALSSVLYKIWTKCYTGTASVFRRIEQKWMCQSHGIL